MRELRMTIIMIKEKLTICEVAGIVTADKYRIAHSSHTTTYVQNIPVYPPPGQQLLPFPSSIVFYAFYAFYAVLLFLSSVSSLPLLPLPSISCRLQKCHLVRSSGIIPHRMRKWRMSVPQTWRWCLALVACLVSQVWFRALKRFELFLVIIVSLLLSVLFYRSKQ